MAAKYPSNDQDIPSLKDDLQLCPLDQQNPGSCSSSSCYNFHMCRDYLLNSKCSEFELNGKCSHSHSLFTRHNQKILEKKLKLSAADEGTFDTIAQLIRTSKSNSSEKISSRFEQSLISDDDRAVVSRSKQTSLMNTERDRSRLSLPPQTSEPSFSKTISSDNQLSTNGRKLHFSTRLAPSTYSDSSRNTLSNSMNLSSNPRHHTTTYSIDLTPNQVDRQEENKRFPMTARSLNVFKHDEKNDRSSSSDDTDENNDASSIAATASRNIKSFTSSVRGFVSKIKDKIPTKSDPNDSIRSDTQMKYVFHNYSENNLLSYLLGPTRRFLVKDKGYQIFPSGYCRLANTEQEKEIERSLQILLPMTLIIDRIQSINDDLAFLISTSAAERIFEQNQTVYSIISEPYTASFPIEVIHGPRDKRTRSLSVPSRKISSASSLIERENLHLPLSDGKFHISSTNSSIDVIRADITETKVDLMVCVSTSATLLNSVLIKAGRSIISQYDQQSHSQYPILLDGGLTSARKILFVKWKLAVESSNTMAAQQSLSDLVKRCIDEAYQLNLTSISFPSIGTGKIGLDPNKVCESMFGAASECLHKYKMDVLFVIYPSSRNDHNQQSYQVFRTYLDNLCKQNSSTRARTPLVAHVPQSVAIPVDRIQLIHRHGECKRISTVSDSSNITDDHKQLVKLLEKLIDKKTYDLRLVQQPFIDQVDLLIDVCLDYHVLPRIDFVKNELTLRGDRDSCSQCFTNLRNHRLFSKYSIFNQTDRKSEDIKMNIYVSMKIDEAFTNEESNIRIEDDDKTVFDIDLKTLKVHINSDTQAFSLYREQLNDSKILLPKSWSPFHLIRTVEVSRSLFYSTECVDAFEQTMPKTEWRILQVEGIENWPLYVHYARKKSKDEIFAFHGCSFSSVQSIIHYGLHSNYNVQPENSIHLTRDALSSHIRNTRRSTDGKYYMFVVRLSKKLVNQESINLSNENAHLTLLTHLIVYQRQIVL